MKNQTFQPQTNSFVFVHGLCGWGSYDLPYRFMPYWGMFGGDLIRFLNRQGLPAYAASVDPNGSAWDRACELFAQLSGTRVDYGKAHSAANGHPRFGKDYSGRPLVPAFDAAHKLDLIGHSFGGTTIRLLAHLLAFGAEEEQAATPASELSGLFSGGKGDWLNSLTTLATPHNGTTAYCDTSGDEKRMGTVPERLMTIIMESLARKKSPGRPDNDLAEFDMYIDHAFLLNKTLTVQDHLYYFSFPCCTTELCSDGKKRPVKRVTEPMFRATAELIGSMRGTTTGGFTFGEEWFDNDGLVNTISARAPFGAPQKEFEETDIPKGVWNIMPVTLGDHMALEGGLFHVRDVRPLFLEHLNRINRLP